MEDLISFLMGLFPEGFQPEAMLQIFAFITLAVVVLGMVGKIAFGKGTLDHAVASSIAILFVYTFFAILCWFDQELVDFVIDKLPLISFDGKNVTLFKFEGADYAKICDQALHVLILTFAVITLDDLIPDSKNTLSWYIMQFVITLVAVLGYCFFVHCVDTYIPDLLSNHAPMILVSILLFMLFLGLLNIILSLMLTVVNPLIGAVYTFFLGSKLGKIITKSFLSTATLFALTWFVEHLGYSSFDIMSGTFWAFTPLLILLLVLWRLVGFLL